MIMILRYTLTKLVMVSRFFYLIYVDGMIITWDDEDGIQDLKAFLHSQFEMKYLGLLSYLMDLEVATNSIVLHLSQMIYAYDLIAKAGLTESKITPSPL